MDKLDWLETPVNSALLQETTADNKIFHIYSWQNIKT